MALKCSDGWPLHEPRNLFRNNSNVFVHRYFVHSLEDLQKTVPTLEPVNTVNFMHSVLYLKCCNYTGSIRTYYHLTKMSTKNIMFWPWEADFYKIFFSLWFYSVLRITF